MGKRGGARAIYILRNESFPVFLIAVYSNNEKANLNKNERNHLAKIADFDFRQIREMDGDRVGCAKTPGSELERG